MVNYIKIFRKMKRSQLANVTLALEQYGQCLSLKTTGWSKKKWIEWYADGSKLILMHVVVLETLTAPVSELPLYLIQEPSEKAMAATAIQKLIASIRLKEGF